MATQGIGKGLIASLLAVGGAVLCCVLCRSVDLIERVSANEFVERQPALPVQLDEPWNELSRVAVALIRPDQANAAT